MTPPEFPLLAPAELRAKADLVDRCGHPTSAVCLSELLRPPPRPEGAVPASKKDGRGREVRDLVPRDVQRNTRCQPREAIHLGCIRNLLEGVARNTRLPKDSKTCARIAESPRRQLNVEFC